MVAVFAMACGTAALVAQDRPAPLTREAIWADRDARVVFQEAYTGEPDAVLAPTAPKQFGGGRRQGVVEKAGPAGENAYMVDFDIPANGNQRMRLTLPKTEARGIHFRFLLKLAPEEPGREKDLAMELNRSSAPIFHTIYHAEPVEEKHVRTGQWLNEVTAGYWRRHTEYVHRGWVLYQGDTASYPLRKPPQEHFDGLDLVVINRSQRPISLKVLVAGIKIIRRDIFNLPEMKAVMETPHPFLKYTSAQIALARTRLAEQPERYRMPRWVSDKLRKADQWIGKQEPFQVLKVQAGWPGAHHCEADGCRGRLQPNPPKGYLCPTCGKEHVGEKYDRLLAHLAHQEAGAATAALGFAWQWTGDERYARKAAEILLAYAQAIHEFRLGHNWLGDCWLMEDFLFGYDYVYQWMPAASRRKINDSFLMPVVKRIYHYNHHYPEGQIRMQRVCGWASTLAKDRDWMAYLLFSPTGNRGVLLRYGLTSDMVSLKGPAYHGDIVRGFNALGTTMENVGVMFFDDTVKGLYDAIPAQAMPDGSLPAFGHTNVGYGASAMGLGVAYRFYRDDAYLALLPEAFRNDASGRLFWENPQLPEAGPLRLKSSNLPGLGMTILRCRPDSESVLALSWGAPKRNDPARLDVHFYGAGGHLLWGSGITGYANPYYKSWYQTSLSRNVPVVGEASQVAVEAPLVRYDDEIAEGVQMVAARLKGAYPGARQLRIALLFDEGDALVLDLIAVAKKTTVDWVVQLPGEVAADVDLAPIAPPFGKQNGYEVLADGPVLASARAPGRLLLRHAARPGRPARGVGLKTASTAAAEFMLCQGRTGTGAAKSPVALFRHADTASLAFACLMQPFGDTPRARGKITFEKAEFGNGRPAAGALHLDVETSRRRYRVTVLAEDDVFERPEIKVTVMDED